MPSRGHSDTRSRRPVRRRYPGDKGCDGSGVRAAFGFLSETVAMTSPKRRGSCTDIIHAQGGYARKGEAHTEAGMLCCRSRIAPGVASTRRLLARRESARDPKAPGPNFSCSEIAEPRYRADGGSTVRDNA